MPSKYAHYRFGARLLPTLPGEVGRTIRRFRQMFDVGLHGPDLFFYYNPFLNTRIGELGTKFHGQSGREFFTRVGRVHRLAPSEPALAYLYGLLCHYALDSRCHPFVNRKTGEGVAGHVQMETEFDRFLLERDGKLPPHTQDLSRHIRLASGDWDAVAAFYPGARGKHIRACVRNMALFTRLLTPPEGVVRKFVGGTVDRLGGSAKEMFMPEGPDLRCSFLNGELMALYEEAECRYPELLRRFQAHLDHNAPLGEEFAPDFG